MKEALTKWGYVGGKINFIVCTYLMCIDTRNEKTSWLQQSENPTTIPEA